jgi:CubicO group peptidase (beta-lactamase class C family)
MSEQSFRCISRFAAPVVIATALFARVGHAQEPFPGIDAYITKAMADWKVPGLAVAIVRGDSVIYARGYGVRKVGTTDAVNDRTLFEIGSSSKSFTATLVAMMVSDGKMRWDDRLTKYLPDLRVQDPVANAEITVRDALTHRTGLSRHDFSWMSAGVSREELLRRAQFIKPAATLRTRFIYQNVMYLAAGQAAGKAAGSSWDELLRTRIFTPLNMTSSLAVMRATDRPDNLSTPHLTWRDTVYAKEHMDMDDIAPAGAIVSNARDMAQWLRFQANDGMYAGKRLLSSIALRETHSPQMLIGAGGGVPGADSLTRFNTYGMGWMVQDYRGKLVWQHGGNTDGMTTAMGLLPDQKFGVVVLSNQHGSPLPDLLMRYLFDRELGAPMRDLSAEAFARISTQRRRADSVQRAQAASRPAGAQPPLALTAYEGTYADSLYGEAKVSVKDGVLVLERGAFTAPLEFFNGGNFRWGKLPSGAIPELMVKFDVSPDGRVTTLALGVGADSAYFMRRPTAGAGRGGRQ